jgi:hypothetical protein
MTTCNDERVERRDAELAAGAAPTPQPDTAILVTYATQRYPLTARAEGDVHTAIVDGLAAYMMTMSTAIDGRWIAFSRVVSHWADHDDGPARSPSAVVNSTDIGRYRTDSGMAPGMPRALDRQQGTDRLTTVQCTGIYQLDQLTVEIACEDKIQRTGVRMMLEAGFSPVDWMAGFKLVLPRYHNAIAEYLLVSAQQPDAQDQAAAGLWPLMLQLRVQCPVYRVDHRPLARINVEGTI